MEHSLVQHLSIYYCSNNKPFFGGSLEYHQNVLMTQRLHVLDVVLLAYSYLAINTSKDKDYVSAFFELCGHNSLGYGPTAQAYRSACMILASVKRHLKDLFGIVGQEREIRFELVNYVFGKNKQSLCVIVKLV